MTARIAVQAWNHKRKDQRVQGPIIRLVIDGEVFRTDDWSLGGFSVSPYRGFLRAGDRFVIAAVGPVAGGGIRINALARVVRIERTSGKLGAAFEGLDTRTFDVLQDLMAHRTDRFRQVPAAA